jgi:hypothetical protein
MVRSVKKEKKKTQTNIKANMQSQMNIFEDTFSIFSQLFTHFDMTERTITDNINDIINNMMVYIFKYGSGMNCETFLGSHFPVKAAI